MPDRTDWLRERTRVNPEDRITGQDVLNTANRAANWAFGYEGMPSRETALGLAGATPAPPPTKDEQRAQTAADAAAAVETDRQTNANPESHPGGKAAPKPEPAPLPTRSGEPGRMRLVTLPDGRRVATNLPEGPGTETPISRIAGDSATGKGGFAAPGAEKTPRFTGEKLAAAYGESAPDGRAGYERARFINQASDQILGRDVERAKARQELAAAEIDPLEAARIQAEGKYGGEVIQQEAMASRIGAAVQAYGRVTEQINQVMKTVPPSPDRDRFIERLERERREYGNLLLGLRLSDPRQDAAATLLGMMGSTPSTAPAPTSPQE